MKIGIIGSRELSDEQKKKAEKIINELLIRLKKKSDETIVISGGAKGIDSIAEKLANIYKIPIIIFLPNYRKYGRIAPIKRNELIVKESDVLIAIKNKDYESRGTTYTVNLFKKRKPDNLLYFLEI